jgi:hypothetical protein
VSDDLDCRRNEGIDIETRRAYEQDGYALVCEAYEEELEIERVFGDGPGGRYKGDARRPWRLRLKIRCWLLIRHNNLSKNPFGESIL